MAFAALAVAALAAHADACTTYTKVAGTVCAESCLARTAGCPVALVAAKGGLAPGTCAALGFTAPAGQVEEQAGPCGTLVFQMFDATARVSSTKVMPAPAATTKIPLVTFNAGDATFRKFTEMNDPVMGGQSTGNYTAQGGVGVWRGEVAIVPSLQAPGFITIRSETGDYTDVSSCTGVAITARTGASYAGYRFSFGTKRGFFCSFFSSGFKAHFDLAPSRDFTTVTIPFTDFSDCNSDSTGEPSRPCNPATGGTYCPDKATLENLKTVTLWAEGAAGTVNMDIQKIEAVGCAAPKRAAAAAAAPATVPLVTFDGTGEKTAHTFRETNDPVMGGRSTGTFSVQDGAGVFDGNVVDVPFLKAPGFIKANADPSDFADISSCKSIVINAKAAAKYDGYRISIGTKRNPSCSFFSSGYKAHFNAPVSDDFQDIKIALSDFSDCNSDATGEPSKLCKDDPSVCPDAATLANIRTLSIWAEGADGTVHLAVKSIAGADCGGSLSLIQDSTTRPPKEFDVCSAKVQEGLRYNMSSFDTPAGVPVSVDPTESLATAICCDSRTKVFAEPQFLYEAPNVQLFARMNQTGLTTFYDSVCGLPLFTVPKGRSLADFEADTTEHGWPSFRQEELVAANVVTDKDGFVYSKCGTHLGSYLPDDKGPRWCLDLSCLAGNPAM
eukprot:TRINITY_DN51_c1_g1_i1.p1 TRINITY_DN51_c1_g1~~TRINITY_DN51_c1_g1_i1.p1  ORF type:complete len:669 (+),score=242.37 TRINITY_DN51_c1_g1_i1:46-2052(+)